MHGFHYGFALSKEEKNNKLEVQSLVRVPGNKNKIGNKLTTLVAIFLKYVMV